MNLTLALLAGLLLLLPGLAVLVAWNMQGGRHGARRPEIQLTSINALFIALAVSLVGHFVAWALAGLVISAAAEANGIWPHLPIWWPFGPNPFETAILAAEGKPVSLNQIAVLVMVIVAEAGFAFRLTSSEGLDLAIDGFDGRSQGWVYQNVVRPTRHGLQPVAYVLTTPVQGNYGLGYRGVVVEARQGADGELKVLALADPEQFVYEILPGGTPEEEPRLRNSARRAIEGVLALEAPAIRNILIQSVPDDLLDEIDAVAQASEGAVAAMSPLEAQDVAT